MRIAIVAPGSRGDVQPYIALGKGLKKAGHAVRLVTHQDFSDTHVTGYWFLDSEEDWTPPSDLMEFLQASSPLLGAARGGIGGRAETDSTQKTDG